MDLTLTGNHAQTHIHTSPRHTHNWHVCHLNVKYLHTAIDHETLAVVNAVCSSWETKTVTVTRDYTFIHAYRLKSDAAQKMPWWVPGGTERGRKRRCASSDTAHLECDKKFQFVINKKSKWCTMEAWNAARALDGTPAAQLEPMPEADSGYKPGSRPRGSSRYRCFCDFVWQTLSDF